MDWSRFSDSFNWLKAVVPHKIYTFNLMGFQYSNEVLIYLDELSFCFFFLIQNQTINCTVD